VIVIDFDGTITRQDSNALLVEIFGDEYNQEIEQRFIAGKMGTREAMEKHFANLKLTQQQYNDFILQEIEIDPGFHDFYRNIRRHNLPLAVVSGGFINAIEAVFQREGLSLPTILANKLVFSPEGIRNVFYHKRPTCSMEYGPCGNCKADHIRRYKQDYEHVIFIGDGLTDRCAARIADAVFAKGRLASYCRENYLPYREFEDFSELNQLFFGRVTDELIC
jgi:2-hydroxy-3-keto-5-methylthiopentenyl-1-phosphate phosphatase